MRQAHLAAGWGCVARLQDEATRKKQAGLGEVAGAGERAGAERAECGGILPGARVVCVAFLRWKKRLREADGGQGEVRAPLAKFVEVKLVTAGPGLAGAAPACRGWRATRGWKFC